jgi:hypothetical protein
VSTVVDVKRRSGTLEFVTLFVIAAAVRLGLAIVVGAFQRQPAGEIFAVAQSIVGNGVFGNPGGLPSGPTAHVAPIYPYMLAALLKLTSNTFFPTLVTMLNILVASCLWALLPATAVRLGLPRHAGVVAGTLGAVNPLRHWVELNGYWEATLSGLALMGMVAFTFDRRATWTKWSTALSLGVGWGLLVLLQPAAITAFVVVLYVLMTVPESIPSRAPGAALVVVSCLLTLTPWTIRNYRTFGGFIFVRGDLGVELSVSNNNGALPFQENVLLNPEARHPHVNAVEFRRRNELGELRYDRSRLSEAAAWMAANPSRFVWLTARRVWLFWIPQRSYALLSLVECVEAVLAGLGLWSLFKIHAAGRTLILGLWMTYPILYYIVQADGRYRYPIEWTIVLAAALGVSFLAASYKSYRGWKFVRD